MTSAELRTLERGAIVAGDYRVVRPLAEGGMGSVFVVEQLSTGSQRALKVVREELLKESKMLARFQQEARVSARIASDHVVQVMAAGVDPATQLPFMVMELLQGETLLSRVQSRGPFERAAAIELFEQLCHALAAAHDIGVIHRDLKPENVFLAKSRRANASTMVKVLDFGVAKVLAEARTTATGAIGTPSWMAPEQTEAQSQVSPATDIWALALLAFYVLTGKYYWRSCNDPNANVTALMRELLFEPLVPASERARALGAGDRLSASLDPFFARCLVRSPHERCRSIEEAERLLFDALEPPKPASGGGTLRDATVRDSAPKSGGETVRVSSALSPASAPRISPVPPSRPQQEPARASAPAIVAPPPPPRSARPNEGRSKTIALVAAGLVAASVGGYALVGAIGSDKRAQGEEEPRPVKLPSARGSAASPAPAGPAGRDAHEAGGGASNGRVACSRGPTRIFFGDDFRDAKAGWTLDDPWQIGPATASKSTALGSPDPGADRSGVAGGSIAGVVLGGPYKRTVRKASLTSPAFDASGATRLVLQFYRFLNTDEASHVPHTIEASRDGGATWTELWRTGSQTFTERAWTLQTLDLTPYAASNTRVRFSYEMLDPQAYSASGWNLDDVVVASSECF